MYYRLCLIVLLLIVALNQVEGKSSINPCIVAIDTQNRLDAAGYYWDFLDRFNKANQPHSKDVNIDEYVVEKSDDNRYRLSIKVMLPQQQATSTSSIQVFSGNLTNLTGPLSQKQQPLIATAFRVRFIIPLGKNYNSLDLNEDQPDVLYLDYLIESQASCFGTAKETALAAGHVSAIEVYRLARK